MELRYRLLEVVDVLHVKCISLSYSVSAPETHLRGLTKDDGSRGEGVILVVAGLLFSFIFVADDISKWSGISLAVFPSLLLLLLLC